MQPIVTFDSSLGPRNAQGLPEGKTTYHGSLPKGRQRWRVEFEAVQSDLDIEVTEIVEPPHKMTLHDLTHQRVLPYIDELISLCREKVNRVTGWNKSDGMFVITTRFRIYRWR